VALITIPENYEALPRHLAPICIDDRDAAGQPIHPDWIDCGVRPIHKALCGLAARVAGDLWAVSEIADRSVHAVARRHGGSPPGAAPQRLVYSWARWEAKNVRSGGRYLRQAREKYLDDVSGGDVLKDPRDYGEVYEAKLCLDALRKAAQGDEFKLAINLHLQGWTWDEIGAWLGRRPNTLVQQFGRWKRGIIQSREPTRNGRDL
jgi:hypothetical protein